METGTPSRPGEESGASDEDAGDEPGSLGDADPARAQASWDREQEPVSSRVSPSDRPLDLDIGSKANPGANSLQQAARWLLGLHDWEAIDDEVSDAIQGFEPPEDVVFDAAREALAEMAFSGKAGLALITCPRTQAYGEQIGEIWERFGSDWLEILVEHGDLTEIVTRPRFLEEALDALGPEAQAYAPLSEIRLCRPLDALSMLGFDAGARPALEAALGLATSLLETQGIDVRHARTSRRCIHLLVPSRQGARAVAMIDGLAHGDGAWPSEGGDPA